MIRCGVACDINYAIHTTFNSVLVGKFSTPLFARCATQKVSHVLENFRQ